MMIELDHPVKVDGTQVDTINLRRPRVLDILLISKLKGNEVEKEIRMFANLCEVSPAVIEQLDLVDYGKLQQAYKDFLSSSQ